MMTRLIIYASLEGKLEPLNINNTTCLDKQFFQTYLLGKIACDSKTQKQQSNPQKDVQFCLHLPDRKNAYIVGKSQM